MAVRTRLLGLPTIHETSHERVAGRADTCHCQQLYDTKPYLEHRPLLLMQRAVKARGTISNSVSMYFVQTFDFVRMRTGY